MAERVWERGVFNPQTNKVELQKVVQTDYCAFGSPEHAALLKIRPVEKNEKPAFEFEGFTFVDESEYLGPLVRPEFVQNLLRSKVRELKAGPPPLPLNAPTLWMP